MAADYQTGIASSPTNLLQTLVTWLQAQGWSLDSSASDGAGWRAHLHKNGLYVNFRAAENEQIWPDESSGKLDRVAGYGLGLYLGDGYSGAAAWHKQSGRPTRFSDAATLGAGMNLPAGSIADYHFFDDGNDHITVVVEKSPAIFVHIGWGPSMVKTGFPDDFPYFFGSSSPYHVTETATGGTIYGVTASAHSPMSQSEYDAPVYGGFMSHCFVRVDATTFAGRWVGNGTGTYPAQFWTGRYMRCAERQDPNAAFGEGEWLNYLALTSRSWQVAYPGALLLPLHCFVLTDPGARWAPLGYPPTVNSCRAVGHGFASGEVYQVGGVDYMVFPNFAVLKAV